MFFKFLNKFSLCFSTKNYFKFNSTLLKKTCPNLALQLLRLLPELVQFAHCFCFCTSFSIKFTEQVNLMSKLFQSRQIPQFPCCLWPIQNFSDYWSFLWVPMITAERTCWCWTSRIGWMACTKPEQRVQRSLMNECEWILLYCFVVNRLYLSENENE